MKDYEIRDISLAPQGHQKIAWVRDHMPLLRGLEEEFAKTKPFAGVKITLSVHLEAKTAYLCKVLAVGGAQMSITGSNPHNYGVFTEISLLSPLKAPESKKGIRGCDAASLRSA